MAIILAVLYFGLIELLMIDSSRELAAARRFRARIIAQTLAENAAEGAALKIASPDAPLMPFRESDEQGEMNGFAQKVPGELGTKFVLVGNGVSSGLESARAAVRIEGRIVNHKITIDLAQHSQ